jgi:hypothetical protein
MMMSSNQVQLKSLILIKVFKEYLTIDPILVSLDGGEL